MSFKWTSAMQCLLVFALMGLLACSDYTEESLAYEAGVFPDHYKLRNHCEVTRTGRDISGRQFNDTPGTLLHELQWLRSWSNDTYLWYDEIIDQNPIYYQDPVAYFAQLKTDALTPTGRPKDNFHFAVESQVYQELNQTGRVFGYGLRLQTISNTPDRDIRVVYAEPLSSAGEQGVKRGARLLSIDGIDIRTDLTAEQANELNAALSPRTFGESHDFLFQYTEAAEPTSVTLIAGDVIRSAVLAESVIDTATGPVGYLVYNTFNAFSEPALIDSMAYFQESGITDLILDLRYNGGGLLNIASELAYMIAGSAQTENRTFYRFTFNDKYPDTDPVTGITISPTPFYATSQVSNAIPVGTSLPALNLNRVYVLTTQSTCSASEAVINGLRGIDLEVIIIGDSTCGKPYGFYGTDNCGTTYFTIQITGTNDKGFGEYPDGFTPENASGPLGVLVPGCQVADDITRQFGDTQESLLASALEFRESGTCLTSLKHQQQQKAQPNSLTSKLHLAQPIDHIGTIMVMPDKSQN